MAAEYLGHAYHRFHTVDPAGRPGRASGTGGGAGGGSGYGSQITAWVERHFTTRTVGGMTVYDLSAAAASG